MSKEIQTNSEVAVSTDTQESTSLLSRSECNIMRGFAILFIIIDNITHLFKGVFLDCEYNFLWSSVEGFLNNLSHPDSILPFNLVSFYCPYGVILFIFLSGYCLTLKYEKGNGQGTSAKDFVANHYKKLFTMQLKGLAIFFAFLFLFNHEIVLGYGVVLQTLLAGNLINISMPGPYWFFGMIMEMYIIYRLVIYRRSDTIAIVLSALSLLVMAFTDPEGTTLAYMRMNCFLAILPFCLGVLAARHLDNKYLSIHKGLNCLGWFILSLILLTLCKFNFYSWLFLPIFVIASAVTIVKLITRVKLFDNIFGWLGALSGVLFVVHPAVREILISRINATGSYYPMLFIYLLITFGLSIMLKPLILGKKSTK